MIFKLLWDLLKNVKWIVSVGLVALSIYFSYLQYNNFKASPISSSLGNLQLPPFLSQFVTTPTPSVPSITPYPSSVRLSVVTGKGPVIYTAEVAQTTDAIALGLMHRTKLSQYSGMYFVFDSDVQYGFWMKNCEIPLDMVFIDAQSTIVDIKSNIRPCKEIDPTQQNCPSYVPKSQYRTVLEINGGNAIANGIKIGDKVSIP